MFSVFDTISQSFSLEKSSERIILEKIVAVCEEVSDSLLQCKYQCLCIYIHSYVYMFERLKRISKLPRKLDPNLGIRMNNLLNIFSNFNRLDQMK